MAVSVHDGHGWPGGLQDQQAGGDLAAPGAPEPLEVFALECGPERTREVEAALVRARGRYRTVGVVRSAGRLLVLVARRRGGPEAAGDAAAALPGARPD